MGTQGVSTAKTRKVSFGRDQKVNPKQMILETPGVKGILTIKTVGSKLFHITLNFLKTNGSKYLSNCKFTRKKKSWLWQMTRNVTGFQKRYMMMKL
jgi:hypothetical protein